MEWKTYWRCSTGRRCVIYALKKPKRNRSRPWPSLQDVATRRYRLRNLIEIADYWKITYIMRCVDGTRPDSIRPHKVRPRVARKGTYIGGPGYSVSDGWDVLTTEPVVRCKQK